VATIDDHGFMQITDRAKDVVKSGGEWISTIDIENIAVGHPKAALAAVIGVPHPKWDERPILLVKLKPGETATKEEFLDFLQGKIAKWWMPDDVLFSIPLGATGKIDLIRARLKDYVARSGQDLVDRARPMPTPDRWRKSFVETSHRPPEAGPMRRKRQDQVVEPVPRSLAIPAVAEPIDDAPLRLHDYPWRPPRPWGWRRPTCRSRRR
jgi:hypothetical protein